MKKIILTLLIGIPFISFSYPRHPEGYKTPYEKCSDINGEHTNKALDHVKNFDFDQYTANEDIEASPFCIACMKNVRDTIRRTSVFSQVNDISKYIKDSDGYIHPECFFASNLRGFKIKPKGNYFHCSDPSGEGSTASIKSMGAHKNKAGKTYHPRTRPFCFSKSYVKTVAWAFNKIANCFDLNTGHRNQMFSLFNHEGSFILNNRSNTGARCFGQMTKTAIREVHRLISLDEDSTPMKKLYNKAIKKCPGLSGLHPDLSEKRSWKRIPRNSTCSLTHNPYKCTFYSMFYAISNIEIAKETLNSKSESSRRYNEEVADKLGFPIALNEILMLKAVPKTQGKNKVDMLMYNEVEANSVFSYWDKRENYNLEARKTPFFDEATLPKIRDLTALWSYNAGPGVVKGTLTSFIRDFKQEISKRNCKEPYCAYRKKFMAGKSMTATEFQPLYKDYMRTVYVPKRDKQGKQIIENGKAKWKRLYSLEAVNFIDKVKKDQNVLVDNNEMQGYLEAFKKGRESDLNQDFEQTSKHFLKDHNEKCGHIAKSINEIFR